MSYQNIYKLTIVNSDMRHPQEIEVWYIMPAIRKELCRVLLTKHKLTQKEIAKRLNITGAAVSQYKKDKRGQHVNLPEGVLSEINQLLWWLNQNKYIFIGGYMKYTIGIAAHQFKKL